MEKEDARLAPTPAARVPVPAGWRRLPRSGISRARASRFPALPRCAAGRGGTGGACPPVRRSPHPALWVRPAHAPLDDPPQGPDRPRVRLRRDARRGLVLAPPPLARRRPRRLPARARRPTRRGGVGPPAGSGPGARGPVGGAGRVGHAVAPGAGRPRDRPVRRGRGHVRHAPRGGRRRRAGRRGRVLPAHGRVRRGPPPRRPSPASSGPSGGAPASSPTTAGSCSPSAS